MHDLIQLALSQLLEVIHDLLFRGISEDRVELMEGKLHLLLRLLEYLMIMLHCLELIN